MYKQILGQHTKKQILLESNKIEFLRLILQITTKIYALLTYFAYGYQYGQLQKLIVWCCPDMSQNLISQRQEFQYLFFILFYPVQPTYLCQLKICIYQSYFVLKLYKFVRSDHKMLKKLKEIIKKFDVFAQPATFRYNQQPQYQSLTGGIVSIIMMIVFVSIFYNTVLRTFNKDDIESKVTYMQDEDPSFYQFDTNTFMFAIGLQGFDLNQPKRLFNIYFQKRLYTQGSKGRQSLLLNLTKCTKDQWIKLKPSLTQAYDNLDFNKFLCPTQGTTIELQGKYSSDIFKFYKIGVKACTPTPNTTCATSSQIQEFLKKDDGFKFNFYYLNTLINSGNKEYLGSYLSTQNYFLFTPKSGILANFYLSSYSIETDNSILPYQKIQNEQGAISQTQTQFKNFQVKQGDYIKFYIRKSSLTISIQRSFKKIDETMSYIGGLFSSIVFLLFFLSKYNEICYELEVAKNLFHYEKNRPLKSDEFNLLTFFGFLIYCFFDLICLKLPWEKMKKYDESLEQIKKQMDIRLIMKKILYAERMAIAVFDESKAKILHLQVPLTLQEAEEIRKNHLFYGKLQKKYFDYKKIRQSEKQGQMNIKVNNFQKSSKLKIGSQNTNHQLKKQNFPQINIQVLNKNVQKFPKNTRRKSIIQKIGQKLNDQSEKQRQLEQMIQKMRGHVKILRKQIQMGDEVSRNILNKFDPKLMSIFITNQPEKDNQQQQIDIYSIKWQNSEKETKKSNIYQQIQLQLPSENIKTQTRMNPQQL